VISKETYAALADEFRERADETNDAADHDELHAAGEICAMQTMYIIDIAGNIYVERWLLELRKRIIQQNLTGR
jgi:hypothetical protein